MIAESARKYGPFVSLVMPHLYDDAAIEREFGHMYRIVADTWTGGVGHYSNNCRGTVFSNWPSSMNQFDGFIHWSQFSGRGKAILDGEKNKIVAFNRGRYELIDINTALSMTKKIDSEYYDVVKLLSI